MHNEPIYTKPFFFIPAFIVACFAAVLILVVFMQFLRVYVAERTVEVETLRGEASLKRAEHERQILVEQARAERDSASLRAAAIEIVGKAAAEYPEYRDQEFLGAFAEALQSESVQKIIFIPTEANIPITEAGRTAAPTKE